MKPFTKPSQAELTQQRSHRAATFAQLGALPSCADVTLSEALVLGMLRQGVKTYFTVFGHGSTEVGEVLRTYQQGGLLRVIGVRNEIEASHAAAALRWITGEKAAVVTSIGPGALQAMSASLVASSDGIGIWYLLGDETTEDEGFNMQQIPKHVQGQFLQLASTIGHAYSLHTPRSISSALRRGSSVVDHPYRPGPFFLLLPLNTQAEWLTDFNLDELPLPQEVSLGPAAADYAIVAREIVASPRVVIKVGGGGRLAGPELTVLLERSGGVLVHTPIASGCVPYAHPQNMSVGGSKGSICGNFAMEQADLLIAVGTRAVCQSDCSRTGYPNVKRVININADVDDAGHYNHTVMLLGGVRETLEKMNQALGPAIPLKLDWLKACASKKAEWQEIKEQRFSSPILIDEYWGGPVLTQPAAIKIATDWAKTKEAVCLFDAGDVQANGFQVVEDATPFQTFTETGASYMGFAVSALLATGVASAPFYALALTGDGSLTMNPQVLIDGVQHGSHGCILVFDNGRMGAISGLQMAQYGQEFATWNTLKVNYLAWAGAVPGLLALDGGRTVSSLQFALEQAGRYSGLSLIHLPVYFGPDPLGGMGVYGRWNVGNWCDDVQALRHEIGL